MSGRAFLLIADISGYTQFVRQPRISAAHARQIIGRLLKSLVHVSQPPLRLGDLEGDAVFFYVPRASASAAISLKDQIRALHAAFATEIRKIDSLRTCSCDACLHVSLLKLKQVVHEGEVAFQRIGKYRKLFGLDVILVHRMLKTGVPLREYVMMTEQAFDQLGGYAGGVPRQLEEELEGIGKVRLLLFSAPSAGDAVPPLPTRGARALWRWRITWGTVLHWFGKRPREGEFR